MKIPTGIKTRNKIRDLAIIKRYVNEHNTMEEIGEEFGLSAQRIHKIIFANRHLIDVDKVMEKAKRINHLNRLLKANPSTIRNNSTIDILEQIRKEVEGDKGTTVDLSKHSHFTVVVRGIDGTIPENNRILSAPEPNKSIQ